MPSTHLADRVYAIWRDQRKYIVRDLEGNAVTPRPCVVDVAGHLSGDGAWSLILSRQGVSYFIELSHHQEELVPMMVKELYRCYEQVGDLDALGADCKRCILLPICYGGCRYQRQRGTTSCTVLKHNLRQWVELHCYALERRERSA